VKPFAARELLARVRTQLDITRTRRDNTRLRTVEQQLIASEQRYRTLIEESPIAMALFLGPEIRIQYASALTLGYWGKTASVLGLTLREALPELESQPFPALLEQVYATGQPYAGVRQAATLLVDGQLKTSYFTFTYKPLRDEEGRVYGIHQTALDVTEEVQALQQREESEARFRILADATPNMVWAVNPDSSIRYINQAFIDFVGATLAQYEATGWGPYMHPDELETAQRLLTEAIATRTRYTLEHRMRRHDGQYRWLLAQGAPSYFPNGELYGYVGSAIDITELKETNEQLARTNRDLDNFVYTASHDLKAPISNIEGLLRLLEDLLPAELRTDDTLLPVLARMQDAVERFTRTIGHLTDVSKLQQEFAHPAAPTTLAPLIEDVRQDLRPLLAETGGQLAVHVEACPTLVVSEKNLRSMLYNLVSNALKYHHPDRPPVVRISCRLEGDCRVLRVQDNGLGLTEGQQTKLFGLFERLHTHVEGTGVGLYMVKKMVENAGGTISVQSQAGEGSTFALWFPA
jgi:PAS domain S-box-containing protein